jgi:hypothetical protein
MHLASWVNHPELASCLPMEERELVEGRAELTCDPDGSGTS